VWAAVGSLVKELKKEEEAQSTWRIGALQESIAKKVFH